MARYTGPRCKLMRREQIDLLLVSARRSLEAKCKLTTTPGQHGSKMKNKLSGYGVQLREKQKIKRLYGLLEKQFYLCFAKASKMKGATGDNLLKLLESRLDNIVYRMGFASTRSEARQLVSHGAIQVNSKKVNIPSYLVKIGDVITIKESAKKQVRISEALSIAEQIGFPDWVTVNASAMEGTLKLLPERSELSSDINERLVVEYYSR